VESTPTINDYLAGAILANGFIWAWNLILHHFRAALSRLPVLLLADISLIIYLLAGGTSAYLVSMRASRGHLIVSLKVAALSWILSLLLTLSTFTRPTIGLAATLLVCFLSGGVAGGYFALKRRIKRGSEKP